MRIEAEQSIAVVIDYQEKLMPVMDKKELLISRSSLLLSGLNVFGIPMCATQQYTKGLGMTVPEITAAMGSKEYIEKINFSAYEAVASLIEGKKFVIICGIETHICVLQTIVDLQAKGFQAVLVTDCTTSRVQENKKIALRRAQDEGAILTTSESILFELLKTAGTDKSKQIQRLLK